MKNIPTVFVWDKETRTVINKPLRMVDWVFEGKGIPTRKYDGVAIRVDNGKVFRRYEWEPGTMFPPGFIKVQEADPRRPQASIPGWVPVPDSFLTAPKGVDERALKEAWDWLRKDLAKVAFNNKKTKAEYVNPYAPAPKDKSELPGVPSGTYELCGPRIRGNHEKFKSHVLILHGACFDSPTTATPVKHVPRNFEALKKFLETYEGEGIVWHYNMGGNVLMAKIKRRDFGYLVRVSPEDVKMAYREAEPTPQEPVVQVPEQVQATATATGNTIEDSLVAQL